MILKEETCKMTWKHLTMIDFWEKIIKTWIKNYKKIDLKINFKNKIYSKNILKIF